MAANERLTEYRRKRDFGKTKEPRGKAGQSRRKSLGFFVQKHAATRLHYDLRLEWDGVLLSWAVTKGPSPDPGQKRLAVRTEDHPLSYAEFEGTIPKKEYGGGTVMLWDKGRWLPRDDTDKALKNGKLRFLIEGERMQGGWTLVRMKPRKRGDRENWLLIKERDQHAGHDPDELVDAHTTSISTSRTMEQIARDEKPPHEKAQRKRKGTRKKARTSKAAPGQEFVIGGFTPSDKRGRPFASLLIGTFEDDEFRYRGRVGSGFSETSLEDLERAMKARRRKTSPFAAVPRAVARNARWVRPDMVAEIDFTELTDGGHVRHGVFKGLREDKKPAQVTLERAPGTGQKAREEYHGIRISNPHRVIYPKQGITKVELARYYDAVATRMLPHVVDRPLSLLRCPKGRGDECFFQKHASAGFPDALMRVDIREKSSKRADYLYVDGIKGIIAAVQMGTLEFHIWGSRIDALEKPERLVFDLDPDETLDFAVVRLAAAVLRQRLEKLGVKTVALVTGGKGVHVIAPLRRTANWAQVKAFAKAFATKLATDEPDVFTATMSKSRRRGRIFVDWLRNERGSTAIAPYSARARENGPIATPVGWSELEDLESANGFRIDDVMKRMQSKDPWEKSKSWRQSITAKLLERVSAG